MTLYYLLTDPDPGSTPKADEEDVAVTSETPEGFTSTVFLNITTDDNGLIEDMRPPPYRANDAVIKQLLSNWNDYLTTQLYEDELEGSPVPLPVASIAVFETWIQTIYGTTYVVRKRA